MQYRPNDAVCANLRNSSFLSSRLIFKFYATLTKINDSNCVLNYIYWTSVIVSY